MVCTWGNAGGTGPGETSRTVGSQAPLPTDSALCVLVLSSG